MDVQWLKRRGKPDLAYVYSAGADDRPVVMFCGGYASDMGGTKATYFESVCKVRGQSYVRFDYAGHGQSGGDFKDGTIGSWFEDSLAVFDHVIGSRRAVIVGSSMGGWIGLLLTKARAGQVKGFVGIAAAPDFTLGLYDHALNDAQRAAVQNDGFVTIPNDYSDDPYIFTKALFEDGERNFVLDRPQGLNVDMHLFQGRQDTEVHEDTPFAIEKVFPQSDITVHMIDDGDHRLSRPQDLAVIDAAICACS